MSRQINFYMEEQLYRQIVEKAFATGFVILWEERVCGKRGDWLYQYHRYEAMPEMPFTDRHYLYNPSLGGFIDLLGDKQSQLTWEEITERKLSLSSMFAPMIEAQCSRVSDVDKSMVSGRLYVRSDYYDSQGALVNQSDTFLKQYSALARAVKKLAPQRKIQCKPPYADRFRKEYMTDYLFSLLQDDYQLRQ